MGIPFAPLPFQYRPWGFDWAPRDVLTGHYATSLHLLDSLSSINAVVLLITSPAGWAIRLFQSARECVRPLLTAA
jgi:hypothetical protein